MKDNNVYQSMGWDQNIGSGGDAMGAPKVYWLGTAYNERTKENILVRSNLEGRNLSQNGDIPQEYCREWFEVLSISIKDARAAVLQGKGRRHS